MAADSADHPDSGPLQITLTWSPAPRTCIELALRLPTGATVADALNKMDDATRLSAGFNSNTVTGVWGKKAGLTQRLQDGDRVEIYRSLLVDPKTARRERFNQQGTGKAGLFASRRAGAKAGY